MSNIIESTEYRVGTARDLGTIGAEIRTIAEQTRNYVLNAAVEIGRRLTEAKELLPHGKFTEWVTMETDFSKSAAADFMKIFEVYGAKQLTLMGAVADVNVQALGDLSYTKLLRLIAIPEAEREDFAKDVDAENISTRQLEAEIKTYKVRLELEQKRREEAESGFQAEWDKNQEIGGEIDDLIEKIAIQEEKLKEQPIVDLDKAISDAKAESQGELEAAKSEEKRLLKELGQLKKAAEKRQREFDEILKNYSSEKDGKDKEVEEKLKAQLEREFTQKEEGLQQRVIEAQKEAEMARAKLAAATNGIVIKLKVQMDIMQQAFGTAAELIRVEEDGSRYWAALGAIIDSMRGQVE